MTDPLVTSDEGISTVRTGLNQWRTQSLRHLGHVLDAYDERSPDDFAAIVEALIQNGLTPQIIAAEFKVSVATISRWAAGKTAPVPYARGVYVRRLREMLNMTFVRLTNESKTRPVLFPVTTEGA